MIEELITDLIRRLTSHEKRVERLEALENAGAGSSTLSPDIPPASPNTEDDEFNSSVLAAKWTKTSSASSDDVNTTWKSCVYVNFKRDQKYNLSQEYAPTGAFSLTAKFYIAHQADYQQCGITVYDDDESDGVRANYEYTNGYKFNLHAKNGGSWTYNLYGLSLASSNVAYICLSRDDSNNWYSWISFDGRSFWRLSNAHNKSITVHHFELELSQAGASIPVRCGIDWIRRDWTTL